MAALQLRGVSVDVAIVAMKEASALRYLSCVTDSLGIEEVLMFLYDMGSSVILRDQLLGQCGHLDKSALVNSEFL